MNKSAIQKFAVWARRELIEQVSQRAYQYGVTAQGYGSPEDPVINGRVLSDDEKKQRKELIRQIQNKGYDQVMEEVAYTWFNRFIALRFMEVNNYLPTHIRVFSDVNGNFKPEILSAALSIDLPGLDRDKVIRYIDGNQEDDLYRYLLLTQCNALNEPLPLMFEKMGTYTELLLPNNILREDGVIGRMVSDIPEEDWTDQVQIIGWLYQYYISELNEQVYDGDMSKKRIPKELMPAATTIYTPDWAVRYMVENSLGRLWIEGHPDEELRSEWKYYLDEAEQEPQVQGQLAKIRTEYAALRPQDIRLIDPCMGSGHILSYAFDIMIKIYEKSGVSRRDAAKSIVENNLYGLDIDERASQLAYFAVMMKGCQYDRRFLKRGAQPKVYTIPESNELDNATVDYFINNDPKIQKDFGTIVKEFRDAKEYGSILNISLADFDLLYARVEEVRDDISLYCQNVTEQILPLIQAAEVMSAKYDVVVTNPPYLGSARFSKKLDEYAKKNYEIANKDLSMIMYKAAIDNYIRQNGFIAFITTSSWMFLSSFEKLRMYINEAVSLYTIVDFGTELFEGKVGHNHIVSWVTQATLLKYKMTAIRLVDYCYSRRNEKEQEFFNLDNRYIAQQANFSKIPGSPVAYWVKNYNVFDNPKLKSVIDARIGMVSGDNDRFLRFWNEVNMHYIEFHAKPGNDPKKLKWYPLQKGGEFRHWYGDLQYVINWENDGDELKNDNFMGKRVRSHNYNGEQQFKEGITWNSISSGAFHCRYTKEGFTFDAAGPLCEVINKKNLLYVLGLLTSKVAIYFFELLNPTINFPPGYLENLPWIRTENTKVDEIVQTCINNAKTDWDSYETSWDFKKHPMV